MLLISLVLIMHCCEEGFNADHAVCEEMVSSPAADHPNVLRRLALHSALSQFIKLVIEFIFCSLQTLFRASLYLSVYLYIKHFFLKTYVTTV